MFKVNTLFLEHVIARWVMPQTFIREKKGVKLLLLNFIEMSLHPITLNLRVQKCDPILRSLTVEGRAGV